MNPSHNMGSDDVFLVSVGVSSCNTDILVESLSHSLLLTLWDVNTNTAREE